VGRGEGFEHRPPCTEPSHRDNKNGFSCVSPYGTRSVISPLLGTNCTYFLGCGRDAPLGGLMLGILQVPTHIEADHVPMPRERSVQSRKGSLVDCTESRWKSRRAFVLEISRNLVKALGNIGGARNRTRFRRFEAMN